MAKSTSTFYKEKFKGTWADSAKKEAFVKEQIELHTDRIVIESGFGAGNDGYIEGSSGSHGFEKAEPDFQIKDTNICIEVTGPLKPIRMSSDLLINPKKVEYALANPGKEYWMAWVNGVTNQRQFVRFVRIGDLFQAGIVKGVIVMEQFESRGFQQFFHSIPYYHPTVITFDRFIQYLNEIPNGTASTS